MANCTEMQRKIIILNLRGKSGKFLILKILRRICFDEGVAGIPVRFVTNETQRTRKSLVDKLNRLGFQVEDKQV